MLEKISHLIKALPKEIESITGPSSSEKADEALKEHFGSLSLNNSQESDSKPVTELIKEAKENSKKFEGTRPQMGLSTPEIEKAENRVQNTEAECQSANNDAENNLNNTEAEVSQRNSEAQSAVETTQANVEAANKEASTQLDETKKTADEQIKSAQEQEDQVSENAQNSINESEENVESAKEAQTNAQNSYNEAENVLRNAEANLKNAEAALANAPEENKEAAQAQVNKAREDFENAKAQLESKKSELEKAKDATEKAESDFAQVKQDSATAIQDARNNTEEITQNANNNIEQAQNNLEQTEASGKENIASAENNAESIEANGKEATQKAQENVNKVNKESEASIESANENLEKVKEESTGLSPSEIGKALNSNIVGKENYDAEKYQQAIDAINPDNVLDYKPNINAENRSIEEYNEDIAKVSDALFKKAEELGVDTSDITMKEYRKKDQYKFKENGETYYADGAPVYENQSQLDKLYQRCEDAILANENAKFREKIHYNNREELASATEARYEELNGQTKPTTESDLDFGNGKIDKISTQETGNCWVQAPLNAIASSEEGNKILSSHMYRDDERGITAIHLQEAENRGLGHNGKGIYTITDSELANAQQELSNGDSDMTAYNLALQKFFIESGERQSLDGGYPERIFEIISGEENDIQNLDVNGVGTCGQTQYEEVVHMAQTGTGATTIKIDQTQRTNFFGVANGGGHALSVVGATEDGKLLIQESNNSGLYLSDLPVYSGETYNGAPTYVMDKDTYYKRVLEANHMYWGA